jgi:hypothetical protein
MVSLGGLALGFLALLSAHDGYCELFWYGLPYQDYRAERQIALQHERWKGV